MGIERVEKILATMKCYFSSENGALEMKRDVALRIDALLMGALGNLDMIMHYMKNNLPDEEYRENKLNIAKAMGELIVISNRLHEFFPDIVPDELRSSTATAPG